MNWEDSGRPVPRERIEVFRASHAVAVTPDLSRNQARRIESSIAARTDVVCSGNCCAGDCDCSR